MLKSSFPFLIVFLISTLTSGKLSGQTPLYFNIISHNEVTDTFDYENSSVEYYLVRNIVKELCDTVISKQAAYNLQVDANFIFGCLQHENANTNSTDLLEWANNSPYIDVDPHNHFDSIANPYNYSDLAHLLDSCGVQLTRKILGGVTYADTTIGNTTLQENWTQYATPKAGYSFPNFLWQADIVWGTATPGHIADYTRFGVWKPAGGSSPSVFGTHDPNASITHIGGGCKDDVSFVLNKNGQLTNTTQGIIDKITQVANYIQTLPSSPNDFYTMNMIVNFRDMPNIPDFVDSLSAIIDGIQPYVNQGKIVWTTLAEKHDLWYATHTAPNDYFNFDCADIVLHVPPPSAPMEKVTVYPNPFAGHIHIESQQPITYSLKLFDVSGRLVYSEEVANPLLHRFHVNVPSGMYLLELTHEDGKKVHSVLVRR